MKKGSTIWKRLAALLLVFALLPALALSAGAEETEEPVCYEHGDVNADGRVNSRDAIYTLYHSMFSDNPNYAVNQDCDFNHDGLVDSQDAMYVLYATFGLFDDMFPLNGTVHHYYEPEWTWTEDALAQVVFRCTCGQTVTFAEDSGVVVETLSETALTCTQNGVVEYRAAVSFGGQEYTAVHTVTTPAQGHSMSGIQSCTESSICDTCGYTLEAYGHSWVADEAVSSEATCQAEAVRAYLCETCGETYAETLSGYAEHTYAYSHDEQISDCGWQKHYVCTVCSADQTGESYYVHTYTAELTQEATCSREGIKTYTCLCGDRYTEAVPTNDSHNWAVYTPADAEEGITYYACVCGAEKTAVCAESNTDISTELLSGSELQLNDVSLQMDEATLENLGTSVAVEVTTVAASELAVDAETMAQIGENPVYDFSMVTTYVDDETSESTSESVSSFGGKITISIPYALQAEDDVDCIDVWFISDDGEITCVQGTYANGFVTFTTDHFSYYTVTRLTPAQRCKEYGHVMVKLRAEASCTSDGYDKAFCQRCGQVERDNVLPMLPHVYNETVTAATCTENGSFVKECTRCHQKTSGTIPALGHSMVTDEAQSREADCNHSGRRVQRCSRSGCDVTFTEEIAQLEHKMELVEEKKNGCSEKGWNLYRCAYCGYEYKEKEQAPHGHYYDPADAIWEWSDDYSSATVTLICSHDKSVPSAHTRVRNAVVSHDVTEATCQADGYAIHTAEVSYNKQDFVNTVQLVLPQTGHVAGDWITDDTGHRKACESCGETMYFAEHNWGDETVLLEPTCKDKGTASHSCTDCGYEQTYPLQPNGEHIFVNEKCIHCGYRDGECTHVRRYEEPIDLSDYGICEGNSLYWKRCDCGEVRELIIHILPCKFNWTGTTTRTGVCRNCGLTMEQSNRVELNKETCETTQYHMTRLSMNGIVLAESEQVGYVQKHLQEEIETVEMSQFGLCPGTVTLYSCYCGASRNFSGASGCDHYAEQDVIVENGWQSYCPTCNARLRTTDTVERDDSTCTTTEVHTETYLVNGKEVFSSDRTRIYEQHDYLVTSYEMAGETCEEGVQAHYQCADCDASYTQYSTGHLQIHRTETPIYGFCPDKAIQWECACGQAKTFQLHYSGKECWWSVWSGDNGEIIDQCATCRLIREDTPYIETGKDANCLALQQHPVRYTDESGNIVVEGMEQHPIFAHTPRQTFTFLGDSCTDGVKILTTCDDCGKVLSSGTAYDHIVASHEQYDLSEYGLCDGMLTITKCPCGQRVSHSIVDNCQWTTIHEENNYEEVRCEKCGANRIISKSTPQLPEDGTCLASRDVSIHYSKDAETLLSVVYSTQVQYHHTVAHPTLLDGATDCNQGYTISYKCIRCDYTRAEDTVLYGHQNYRISSEILSENQFCGTLQLNTFGCACGRTSWMNEEWIGGSCQFGDEYYLPNEDCWAQDCAVCGVTRISTWEELPTENPCIKTSVNTVSFRKDGKEIAAYQQTSRSESHQDCVWSFNMLGTTCEDGYYVTGYCHACNSAVVNNKVQYGCKPWRTSRQVLFSAEEGACSDVILRGTSCPCGTNAGTYIDSNCIWHGYGTDTLGNYQLHCDNCGMERLQTNLGLEYRDCMVYSRSREIFIWKGTQVADVTLVTSSEDHPYEFTFEMEGKTCEEGFLAVGTCADCGKVIREGLINDCAAFPVSRETVLSDNRLCADLVLVHAMCPCGKNTNDYVQDHCNWSYAGWNSDKEADIYRCIGCGLERTTTNHIYWDKENCRNLITRNNSYTMDGAPLADISYTTSHEQHDSIEEFRMLGKSCEDGYYVTERCRNCDYTYQDSSMHTGHGIHTVERYDLTDYGLCGGELYRYACPCGQYQSYSWNDTCSWNYTGKTDSEGREEAYCSNCDTYRYYFSEDSYNPSTCRQEGTFRLKFVRKDQTLLEKDWDICYENHLYLLESYTYRDDSLGCNGGGEAVLKCKFCGDFTKSVWGSDYHPPFNTDYVDLSTLGQDACGGYIRISSCPCGENSDFDWQLDCNRKDSYESYTDANGQKHSVWTYTCPDCPVSLVTESYYVPDPVNCQEVSYNTITLSYNKQIINSWSLHNTSEYHDHQIVGLRLQDGAANCDEGVWIDYCCSRCGDRYQSNGQGHFTMVTESMDLTPYGSVCGSTLDHWQCACGLVNRYDIDENHCDMDQVSVADFIPGILTDGLYQLTTEGHNYYYSYSYVMTCAVTHPQQCHLKIRMSEYWLQEGCEAVEYQTWQLGYDESTDTCMEEFTIPTGERRAFHSYNVVHRDDTANGVTIVGEEYSCPNCGSYASDLRYYKVGEGNWYLNERIAVNTLNNGENQKYRHISNQKELKPDVWDYTLERYEYTYADGTEYWDQYVYEHQYPTACQRLVTYTNSNGGCDTWTNEHLSHSYSKWETIQKPTCTQFGKELYCNYCPLCEAIEYQQVHLLDPIAHSWYQDYYTGIYHCGICGLENINGATGAIVLEDMTAAYGNGENYVVGYWNREGIQTELYATVLLKDIDDELVLSGIQFQEYGNGITAITFSRTEAETAAKTAMQNMGYTGDWAIRFSFVPVNSTDTLDYAITFDSLTA